MIWCEGGEGMGGMVVAGIGGGEGGENAYWAVKRVVCL